MSGQTASFLGSKAFGLTAFRALLEAASEVEWKVFHAWDEGDERSVEPQFRELCEAREIPFACVSAKAAHKSVLDQKPDFVFVCGWYALIDAEVLGSGPKFLGIHNSLLPRYRGGAPLVWALMNGDRKVGSTLFAIGTGMDDGEIYEQIAVEVDPDEHIATVAERIESEWESRLPEIWGQVIAGTLTGSEQDHEVASYCAQRRPEDGRIDWTWPARRIHDFVRAQSAPYPGAFTEGPDGPIRIAQTRLFEAPVSGTPGQIVLRGNDGPVIACGDNTGLVIASASDPNGRDELNALFPTLALRL